MDPRNSIGSPFKGSKNSGGSFFGPYKLRMIFLPLLREFVWTRWQNMNIWKARKGYCGYSFKIWSLRDFLCGIENQPSSTWEIAVGCILVAQGASYLIEKRWWISIRDVLVSWGSPSLTPSLWEALYRACPLFIAFIDSECPLLRTKETLSSLPSRGVMGSKYHLRACARSLELSKLTCSAIINQFLSTFTVLELPKKNERSIPRNHQRCRA